MRAWGSNVDSINGIMLQGMKAILETCPKLEQVRLMVDIPFSKLVSRRDGRMRKVRITDYRYLRREKLGMSLFSSVPRLRSFIVAIPPKHTRGLERFPMSIPASPSASTETKPCDFIRELAQPSMVAGSLSPPASPETSVASASSSSTSASIPSAKDIRRFVKKSSQLVEIVWGGRGGLGTWHLRRFKGTVKVEMTPINQLLAVDQASNAIPRQRMAFSGLSRNAELGLERKRTAAHVPSRDNSPKSFTTFSSGPSDGLGRQGAPPPGPSVLPCGASLETDSHLFTRLI
jgi:hypothetical protein